LFVLLVLACGGCYFDGVGVGDLGSKQETTADAGDARRGEAHRELRVERRPDAGKPEASAPEAGPDAPRDSAPALEAGPDAPADSAPDAPRDAGPDGPRAPDAFTLPLTASVSATANLISLPACSATAAALVDVPAGTYTITLTASDLSKGNTIGGTPSHDDYVLLGLPLEDGAPEEELRYLMLNGVGDSRTVTLAAKGTVLGWFLDSDPSGNTGTATVTLSPGNYSLTIDALANVLAWKTGCAAAPVTITNIPPGDYTVELSASSLSQGPGSEAPYVLVRLPLDDQTTADDRYVSINGVGPVRAFTSTDHGSLSAWFISGKAGSSGQATLLLTTP